MTTAARDVHIAKLAQEQADADWRRCEDEAAEAKQAAREAFRRLEAARARLRAEEVTSV